MRDTDVHVLCGCDAATRCPQGRIGADRRCVVVIPEDDLIRIVRGLPEYQRRYGMNSRDGSVPNVDEESIEKQIIRKGLNAPRLNPQSISAVILTEQYHVFPGTTMTVCCLTLVNGYCVVGESAAVSPDNFDEEIGRSIANRNARDKIWSLEGYLLREKLYRSSLVNQAVSELASS